MSEIADVQELLRQATALLEAAQKRCQCGNVWMEKIITDAGLNVNCDNPALLKQAIAVMIGSNTEPTNTAPVAVANSATTTINTAVSIAVLANDSDADGDTLTIASFTQGANGAVTQSANALIYTPNTGWTGNDTFSYTISDGAGGTASASVNVTVGDGFSVL